MAGAYAGALAAAQGRVGRADPDNPWADWMHVPMVLVDDDDDDTDTDWEPEEPDPSNPREPEAEPAAEPEQVLEPDPFGAHAGTRAGAHA